MDQDIPGMTDREVIEEILVRLRSYEVAAKSAIESAKRNPMLGAMLGGIK